jgi:SAM-dependent methyltransferase
MLKRLEALLRGVIPSTPILTRMPIVGWVLDAVDRLLRLPYPEFRGLPPNRYRVRVGIGNRVFFNQASFLAYGASTWTGLLAEGWAQVGSSILDVGSGCGRTAYALKASNTFKGMYTGIDVDREMVGWCDGNFPHDRFTFVHADVYSSVYNPGGIPGPYRFPLPDGSQDLVMSQSLLTHLLQDDLEQYVNESCRVLRPGGHMVMTVFCLDHLQAGGELNGRWSFKHQLGAAYVESPAHPEAAVAYQEPYLVDLCRRAGFDTTTVRPRPSQSLLISRRAG